MYAYMSVLVCIHVSFCTCVYGYIYVCERTLRVYTDAVFVYPNMCIHIWVCTCVCMCVHLYICMKRHRVCMQSVCIQMQTYMSVFVSCLQVWFICVCRYIHIYVYVRQTPWAHTDTLCAHRNTCIRICVCACVCMYTHVYIWKDTVCAYEFTYVCVYTAYMHVDFTCGCVGV